jgi:hypothetical protein
MNRLIHTVAVFALGLTTTYSTAQAAGDTAKVPVTLQNFNRAETDMYFSNFAKQGAFGKFYHNREPVSVDKQDVIRSNRDTIYSAAVFDLDAGPVTITLPDAGKRYMALLIVNEDAYSPDVVYAPGTFTYTKEKIGTRYMCAIIRTLVDPDDPKDIAVVQKLQDSIETAQGNPGSLKVPAWDPESQKKIRDALKILAGFQGPDAPSKFGWVGEVDPIFHIVGTASGWGGNPASAAKYINAYPSQNDGKTIYKLTVKDVPVDGFWSITVYDKDGYFVKNDLGVYSLNNLTAKPSHDGSVTVQFGGCQKDTPNCIPTPPDWNYTVRMYRPRKEVLDGTWKFPEAQPAS